MASKKEGFYTFTRSYFGVKVYLCRKIVRDMDRQYQSIEELQNEIIYLHRRIDTLKRGIVSFAIGILLGLIGQYLL